MAGCNKTEFLDAKPDQALIIPETLEDMQAILDNTDVFNGMTAIGDGGCTPLLGELGADDYFVGRPASYDRLDQFFKNACTWQTENFYAGSAVTDWSFSYKGILYANCVMEGMSRRPVTEQESHQGRIIQGAAYFHRAHIYFQLAQLFAPVYDVGKSATELGIPLRIRADVNEKIERATVQETYDQIIQDLNESIKYLPQEALFKTRPSKAAAYGLLSRVFQTMENYEASLLNAEKYLELMPDLIDYNTLNSDETHPFDRFNMETAFATVMTLGGPSSNVIASVDSNLYELYDPKDLRRSLFFRPRTQSNSSGMQFRGSYVGSLAYFSGIATDEIYLIKAECLVRMGQGQEALEALNTLMEARWEANQFQPIQVENEEDLLGLILLERRKELVFRGLRWTDLRRLNKDPRFAKTLVRKIEGEQFELPPNDPRYVYPIPDDVIAFYPEMPQNER